MKKIILLILILLMEIPFVTSCTETVNFNFWVMDNPESTPTQTSTSSDTENNNESQSSGDDKLNLGVGLIVSEKNTNASRNVAIKGWAEMTISPNTTKVTTVDFENPIENEGFYYQTFELILINEDGSEECLFKSDFIKPGDHICEINISRGLDVGTYKAKLIVQPYKFGSMDPTQNVMGEMTIFVK